MMSKAKKHGLTEEEVLSIALYTYDIGLGRYSDIQLENWIIIMNFFYAASGKKIYTTS